MAITKKNKANAFALSLTESNIVEPTIQEKTAQILKAASNVNEKQTTNHLSSHLKLEEVKDTQTKNRLKSKNQEFTVVRSITREDLIKNRAFHTAKKRSIFSRFFESVVSNFVFLMFWMLTLITPAIATLGFLYESAVLRDKFLTNDSLQLFWVFSLYVFCLFGMFLFFYIIRNLSLFITQSIIKN